GAEALRRVHVSTPSAAPASLNERESETVGRPYGGETTKGGCCEASALRRETHSHSMVPGGLDVTSRTTRFTSRTSLVMRLEIFDSTSYGRRVQSAVIASSLDTGRSTMGCP